MHSYKFSNARKKLTLVFDQARNEGKVIISHRGEEFELTLRKKLQSPLDIEGVQINLDTKTIVDIVKESRKR